MNRFNKFYETIAGKVIVDGLIGLAVGFLIYLWRGNEKAPWMCSALLAVTAYLKAKNIWPWSLANNEKDPHK